LSAKSSDKPERGLGGFYINKDYIDCIDTTTVVLNCGCNPSMIRSTAIFTTTGGSVIIYINNITEWEYRAEIINNNLVVREDTIGRIKETGPDEFEISFTSKMKYITDKSTQRFKREDSIEADDFNEDPSIYYVNLKKIAGTYLLLPTG